MIDLIHLQRLRQQRLRYEAAQRQLLPQPATRAMAAPRPRSEARRVLLRIVSAALLGAAIDGTAMRRVRR
jgi:hypothetical protein